MERTNHSHDEETRVVDSSGGLPTAEVSNRPVGPELSQGASFGRYVVVRRLGAGGMGVVYLAYDPQLDRGVALKVLRPGKSDSGPPTERARLLREAQVMAKLSHPNVLPVYDVGTVDDRVFVAMEYVEGRSLGQWLRKQKPPWPEVLEAFIGAGRGLAAAHEAGLVHRDFKPDNVMMGVRARPRVMDFGLARTADDESPVVTPEVDSSISNSSSHSAVEVLTRTGLVLGTPAYMPPEQTMGAGPDPASDQFSFCVALYEGLYGERPFAGSTCADLCKAIMAGDVRPPPSGTRVPSWLRRVMLRGLAPLPQDRWPSMNALLGALDRRGPGASRLRGGATMLALGGLLLGGTAWWQGQASPPCRGSEQALAETWNEDARAAIRDAFATTTVPYAEQAAARSITLLDAWGRAWINEHRDACEDTHLRHEQSGQALDLRMRCLQGRLRALEQLREVLDTAQDPTVEHAVLAVEQLPSPAWCADLEALQAELPPPEDPVIRERIDVMQAELERVRALLTAVRYAEAREGLEAILQEADALDYAPLQVRAEAVQAHLLEAEGSMEQAQQTMRRTLWRAETQGMDRLVVELAITLIWLEGSERQEHARGDTWAALASAKLERLGDAPRLRASLERRLGDLADSKSDYAEAAVHYREALDRWSALDPGSVGHATAQADFGKIHFRAGRMEKAALAFGHAAELLSERLGPDHPDVGKVVGNAAIAWHATGDYARARQMLERAQAIITRAFGPDHLSLATTLTNLGSVHFRTGDYEAAVQAGREAIRIKELHLGSEHPKIGLNLNNVAMALSKLGDHEGALAAFLQASDSLRPLGPEHIAHVEPWIGQGEELMHLGRHAEALEPLLAAYELEKGHGHDPRRLALPAFLLAQARWDSDIDRPQALALAAEALAALGEPETAEHRRLAEGIGRWQAEHPAAG